MKHIYNLLLLLSIFLFLKCNEENINTSPTCKITYPQNNSDIPSCTIVPINVIAEDIDGEITKVEIIIDGITVWKETINPKNFEWQWNTNNINLGAHKIQAIAKDNNGASIRDEIGITLIKNPPPQANFTSDLTDVTIYETVNFSDLSTNNPTSWLWDFGDNTTSSQQNPEHEYDHFGEFTVTLTVSNACGSDTKESLNLINVIRVIEIPYSEIPTVEDADGNIYNTIRIGNFCWIAENLRVGKTINSNINQTDNDIIEKYCYEDNEENSNIYGGLYTWDEMMQYAPSDNEIIGTTQGICPDGWHIPTEMEWDILYEYLGGNQEGVGGQLKETGTIHWLTPNLGATNITGFTALPGGMLKPEEGFISLRERAYFYTSVESFSADAVVYSLSYSNESLAITWPKKTSGISVRCVKHIPPDK